MRLTSAVKQSMKNAVTIHEVSRRAGVSLSTVSRVLNDNANVNADMRERVLRAVEDLGYRPNLAAQALKTSRSRMIVFLIPEISNPYYTETYRGIHSVAQQRGYVTLIYEADDVDAAVHSILMRGADGVLIDAVFGNESK
ncbi:MAG TPA: LacI family DNA-binding transcriptional regulator, partial [Spirochaetia bacterium]|nr:LacI family DNA-binding transcriptional regulator [Spirochaetia bacterium]